MATYNIQLLDEEIRATDPLIEVVEVFMDAGVLTYRIYDQAKELIAYRNKTGEEISTPDIKQVLRDHNPDQKTIRQQEIENKLSARETARASLDSLDIDSLTTLDLLDVVKNILRERGQPV